jgi:hypothetical protein
VSNNGILTKLWVASKLRKVSIPRLKEQFLETWPFEGPVDFFSSHGHAKFGHGLRQRTPRTSHDLDRFKVPIFDFGDATHFKRHPLVYYPYTL